MTLKDLLDVINSDRYTGPENGIEKISILDDGGDPEVTARVSSKVLKTIENREVDEIEAIGADHFGIWLKDEEPR